MTRVSQTRYRPGVCIRISRTSRASALIMMKTMRRTTIMTRVAQLWEYIETWGSESIHDA